MVRRCLSLVLALAAASTLALPGRASAQSRRATTTSAPSSMQVGALIGFEDGSGNTGLALRVDGEWYWQALSPQVRLSFLGSVGFSHWTYNAGFFNAPNSSLSIFKFTPALRFSFGNNPTIRPYGDAGIGLHYATFTLKERDPFTGNVFSVSDSDVSAHLRFAGGILFHVSPGVSLGAEIDFIPYFGDVDDNTFSLMFAAVFRI